MLVPRAVLERVGDFDPELYLYAEDVDWSLRTRAAGLRHYLVPRSRVYHKVSMGSGGENMPGPLYYATRNTLVVCERWAPLGPVGDVAAPGGRRRGARAQALRVAEARRGAARRCATAGATSGAGGSGGAR